MTSTKEKHSKPTSKWLPVAMVVVPLIASSICYNKLLYSFAPEIATKDGKLLGRVAYSRNGTEYWEYLGIPYAKSPIGALRFQPPVPVEPWNDTKLVTSFPPLCTQYEGIGRQILAGVEDCLFLNVYTHPFDLNRTEHKLRPVLVNIPGGGYQWGGTQFYGPQFWMDFTGSEQGQLESTSNLVIVNLQYRLGPLGFLNFAQTEEEYKENPLPRGNMGLKDIVMALQWVQSNIAHFGGDPNQITLYGQSAGAVSAHLLMLSPKSQGLFHRVFSQSGTALSHFGFTTQPKQLATNLANTLNCPLNDKHKLLECLHAADPYKLALQQKCTSDPTVERDMFVPSAETVITQDTLLTQHPYELLKSQSFPNMPVVFGMTTGEGAIRLGSFDATPELVQQVQQDWTKYAGRVLGFENFPAKFSEKVRSFYFPNYTSFPEDPQEFKNQLALMAGHSGVYEGIHASAEIHAKKGGNTHLILYDYRPTGVPGMYSFYKAVKPGDWLSSELLISYTGLLDWLQEHVFKTGKGAHQYGAAHSEEMFLIWVVDKAISYLLSQRDLEFSRDYVKSLIDFASGRVPVFRGVPWPVIENATGPFSCLLIDNNGNSSVIPEPFSDGTTFWRSLGIRNFT